MNIFVASWFFPPATSSEGIVTYKLLRNSKNDYDVFSSVSRQWGYQVEMTMRGEKNINSYTIETDDINEWVEACVEKFEELYPARQYDCIMTRSTPPESILIGRRIKAAHPEIKWIASLADPVANNPYEIFAYIDQCPTLFDNEKKQIKEDLKSTDAEALKKWKERPESGIQLMCKLKEWELSVLKEADMIISPTARQLHYILNDQGWSNKFMPVPHSYDKSFYKEAAPHNKDKVIFSFIGYSDSLRSLIPFINALHILKQNGCPFFDQLEVRIIGNNPRILNDMVLNYYLENTVRFYPGTDYYTSLEMMQESDWLIHVDAFFEQLCPGGSIFFAGKIADYMGAGRPIFAMTGDGSPAHHIVSEAGGVCVPADAVAVAEKLEEILCGTLKPQLNEKYIEQFDARKVAEKFDYELNRRCGKIWEPRIHRWPAAPESSDEKLVTICVPSYNVQRYLERCLITLVDHPMAGNIEILVIDDGSKDATAKIGKMFEEHFPGIVRLISKPNGGHGSTINRAIEEGCGKYFMVVDGDDWIDSKQFAKLLSEIKAGKYDTDIISSNYHHVNLESGVCTPWIQQADVEYFKPSRLEDLDTENIYFTLAGSMIKLPLLKSLHMPLQENTFYVDVEYILFPVPKINTVTFTDYFIYKYCQGNVEQSIHIPTMVNRFDHHNRVMMRVLDYANTPMTEAQKSYYFAILKRLLVTQYGLCLVYDQDKDRGYARAKQFDEYLHDVQFELWKWCNSNIPTVRIARRFNFNPIKAEHSLSRKMLQLASSKKEKIKATIKNSRFLRHLLNNSLTRRISKMEYFSGGFGYQLKQKILRYTGR